MTITFSLATESKGSYYRYHAQGRSIYVPKSMTGEVPPATLTLTGEGLTEPKASKTHDPATLQAQADKAAASAERAAARAQKLTEQLERLKAQQPAASAPQPEAKRQRKAKAA